MIDSFSSSISDGGSGELHSSSRGVSPWAGVATSTAATAEVAIKVRLMAHLRALVQSCRLLERPSSMTDPGRSGGACRVTDSRFARAVPRIEFGAIAVAGLSTSGRRGPARTSRTRLDTHGRSRFCPVYPARRSPPPRPGTASSGWTCPRDSQQPPRFTSIEGNEATPTTTCSAAARATTPSDSMRDTATTSHSAGRSTPTSVQPC